MALNKRRKLFLQTLESLGGEATTWQIAIATKLNVRGVSQTLGAMPESIKLLGGRAGAKRWKTIKGAA